MNDLIPFDLAKFKAGQVGITRAGGKAFFVAHDPQIADFGPVIYRNEKGAIFGVRESGLVETTSVSMAVDPRFGRPSDLVGLEPITHTVYVNVYPSTNGRAGVDLRHYESAEAAQQAGSIGAHAVALPLTYTPL